MMGERRAAESAEYVGKRLTFKIQEYKDHGRSILVSNRAIHEEARQAKIETLKQTLQEGMVITGKIASIQSYGAFVDLGGIQALLPVSEISLARVEDIQALLSVGQEIQAAILQIDWRNERISLSMKSLLADPDVVAALDLLLHQAFHRNLLEIGLLQHPRAGRGPADPGGKPHLPVFGSEEEDPELVPHLDGEIPLFVGQLLPVKDPLALPIELQEDAVLGNRHYFGLHRLAGLVESHSGKALFVHPLEIAGIRVCIERFHVCSPLGTQL
jgi:hypothetical protein